MGELWCKRGEAVEKRKGGGGGGGLRADWYGKRKLGIQVDLQITSKVRLVVLHYINFTAGADLTISVSLADLFIQAYQRQESSTL